ncbi:hypothetical protein P7H19_18615 [Paenibacillus larvae]|nr:hypothetical protein [Paenibacillus larvae]MDT2237884.1 hypothetical protein [Paenibacillus larvae]
MEQAAVEKLEPNPEKRKLKRFMGQLDIQLMVLPAMLFIFIFSYIPMDGVLMAFQDFSIFHGFFTSLLGWIQTFHHVFRITEFFNIMRNTMVIDLLKFCIGFPAPILLALILNEVRSIFFLLQIFLIKQK